MLGSGWGVTSMHKEKNKYFPLQLWLWCGASGCAKVKKNWLFTHARNSPVDTRLLVRQSEKPAASPYNLMNYWFKRASEVRASVSLWQMHAFLSETTKFTGQWKHWKGTGRTNWLNCPLLTPNLYFPWRASQAWVFPSLLTHTAPCKGIMIYEIGFQNEWGNLLAGFHSLSFAPY